MAPNNNVQLDLNSKVVLTSALKERDHFFLVTDLYLRAVVALSHKNTKLR